MNAQTLRTELASFARSPASWLSQSAGRGSFGAALVVGLASFGSALLRMGKDLTLAAWFGTRQELDAYLLAITLPLFLTSVLAGSLNSALIPVYIDVRQGHGEPASRRLVRDVVGAATVVLAVVTAALFVLGPAALRVLAARVGPSELGLATRLYPFAAPIVITSGLSTILGGILNARGVFAVPALTPALSSAIPLMALALPSARRSIELIACATLAGYGLELVVLAVVVWRALGRATPVRDGNGDGAAGRVLKGYLPMVGGMIVSAASPLVDQFMSTQLGDGAVATLSFGGKVPAFVMGLGATAVGTAVLPYFSRLVAAKDFVGIRRSLRNWSVAIFVIYLPIMALGFVFARPLIRTLFERGAFHANDTETTARVFLAYLPQLPFYVLGVLGCRLLSALNKNRVIMLIAFLNVLINFVGDYTFMHWLGLPGIALSTSMVYFLSTSLVFAALRNVGEGAGRQRPNAMRTAAGN